MEITQKDSGNILSGRKFPVYLLGGSEEFLQKELAAGLVEFLTGGGEAGDAVLSYDCSTASIEDILNGASQPQMFSPVSVVIVENAHDMILETAGGEGGKKKPEKKYCNYREWERFQKWLESPFEDVHMILIAGTEVKFKKTGKKFVERAYKDLERIGCVVNFPRMYDDGVARWLAGRASRCGLKMSVASAEFMILRAGRDLRHLANELEKLKLYCGKDRVVDEASIELLATSGEDELVFKLVDAIFDGKKMGVLEILEDAKKSGVHPLQVIAGLTANMRMVWQARRLMELGYLKKLPRDYRSGGYSGVKRELMRIPDEVVLEVSDDGLRSIVRKTPFYAHKCARQARKLPSRLLERWAYYCARADRALKGVDRGVGPDDMILDRLVAEMMKDIKLKAVPTSARFV